MKIWFSREPHCIQFWRGMIMKSVPKTLLIFLMRFRAFCTGVVCAAIKRPLGIVPFSSVPASLISSSASSLSSSRFRLLRTNFPSVDFLPRFLACTFLQCWRNNALSGNVSSQNPQYNIPCKAPGVPSWTFVAATCSTNGAAGTFGTLLITDWVDAADTKCSKAATGGSALPIGVLCGRTCFKEIRLILEIIQKKKLKKCTKTWERNYVEWV